LFNKGSFGNQAFHIALKSLWKDARMLRPSFVSMPVIGKNIMQEHTGRHSHYENEKHETRNQRPVIFSSPHKNLKQCCKNIRNISFNYHIRRYKKFFPAFFNYEFRSGYLPDI